MPNIAIRRARLGSKTAPERIDLTVHPATKFNAKLILGGILVNLSPLAVIGIEYLLISAVYSHHWIVVPSWILLCGTPMVWTYWLLPLKEIRAYHRMGIPIPIPTRNMFLLLMCFPGGFGTLFFVSQCLESVVYGLGSRTGIEWEGGVESFVVLVVVIPNVFLVRKAIRLLDTKIEDLSNCPVCNYDLQRLVTPGCPECGWCRTDDKSR